MSATDFYATFRTEASKAVIGQEEPIRLCALAVAVGGHVLLEGVPGTAKTLLAKTIARLLRLEYSRIQFTPDLMPADIVGTAVYDLQQREFRTRRGPIFTNVLLADEINREPNPVEYEGTYPLPEAQQDRFLFKVVIDYPTPESELEVLGRWNEGVELRDPAAAGVKPALDAKAVARCREEITAVLVDEGIRRYIIELAVATRRAGELALGASTRGEVLLLLASKAAAAFEGRDFVTPDDIKGLLGPTFRHRLIVRPEAEVAGQTADSVLDSIIAQVTPPR